MADGARPDSERIAHLEGIPLRHRYAPVNGVRLHWVEAGAGPLIVLAHGFPDFWYGWRRQIPALVAAGHRTVAVDLRGYNESERPRGWRHYRTSTLAADIEALLAVLTSERDDGLPLLVGHDWGGAIAWRVAARRPDAMRGLVILNAPHPAAFLRELRRPAQLLRSWYAIAAQLPWLPEATLRAFDFALLRKLWDASAGRNGMSDADLAMYRSAFERPGALEAALAYYRAAGRGLRGERRPGSSKVSAPTLVLWGLRDPALSPRLTEGLDRWVADLQLEILPRAGHWVHLDRPDGVNRAIIAFSRAHPGRPVA